MNDLPSGPIFCAGEHQFALHSRSTTRPQCIEHRRVKAGGDGGCGSGGGGGGGLIMTIHPPYISGVAPGFAQEAVAPTQLNCTYNVIDK